MIDEYLRKRDCSLVVLCFDHELDVTLDLVGEAKAIVPSNQRQFWRGQLGLGLFIVIGAPRGE
jgi:hypothetical protein